MSGLLSLFEHIALHSYDTDHLGETQLPCIPEALWYL